MRVVSSSSRTTSSPCAGARDEGASVLVVDEGPGISGSTFLGTADALVEAGIPAARITLVCSHEADLESLAGDPCLARYPSVHDRPVPSPRHVPHAGLRARPLRGRMESPRLRRRTTMARKLHQDGTSQLLAPRREARQVRRPRPSGRVARASRIRCSRMRGSCPRRTTRATAGSPTVGRPSAQFATISMWPCSTVWHRIARSDPRFARSHVRDRS